MAAATLDWARHALVDQRPRDLGGFRPQPAQFVGQRRPDVLAEFSPPCQPADLDIRHSQLPPGLLGASILLAIQYGAKAAWREYGEIRTQTPTGYVRCLFALPTRPRGRTSRHLARPRTLVEVQDHVWGGSAVEEDGDAAPRGVGEGQ